MPIITELTDNDLYKFTMQQIAFHFFPNAEVRYEFQCRSDVDLTPYRDEILSEFESLCRLQFQPEHINYLRTLRHKGHLIFKEDYLEYLAHFQMPPLESISIEAKDRQLFISHEGLWKDCILFEIYCLAIVNEIYYRHQSSDLIPEQSRINLDQKIRYVQKFARPSFKFSEFGTRRRFSKENQRFVLSELLNKIPNHVISTSNVMLSQAFNIPCSGTMAHEYLQAFQSLRQGPLLNFQNEALSYWKQEYPNNLNIALTDVVGFDAFLKHVDSSFLNHFDLRHDSGDPVVFADKALQYFSSHNISSAHKTLLFSDGLTLESAIDLDNRFSPFINVISGIGTSLTNDCGFKPINIVMKMTSCNGQVVTKIPDSTGKIKCSDPEYLRELAQTFGRLDAIPTPKILNKP